MEHYFDSFIRPLTRYPFHLVSHKLYSCFMKTQCNTISTAQIHTFFSMSFHHRLWNCDTPIVVVDVVVDAKANLLCISIHENVSFCFWKNKRSKTIVKWMVEKSFWNHFYRLCISSLVTWSIHHTMCYLILVVKTQRLTNNERNKKHEFAN